MPGNKVLTEVHHRCKAWKEGNYNMISQVQSLEKYNPGLYLIKTLANTKTQVQDLVVDSYKFKPVLQQTSAKLVLTLEMLPADQGNKTAQSSNLKYVND